MGGECRGLEGCVKHFGWKPGEETLGRNGHIIMLNFRNKNNAGVDLREIWWDCVDWSHLTRGRDRL